MIELKKSSWTTSELSDIYRVDATDQSTNEQISLYLTWTRMVDLSHIDGNPIRMYDIEHENNKHYFLLFQKEDAYLIKYHYTENPTENTLQLADTLEKQTI